MSLLRTDHRERYGLLLCAIVMAFGFQGIATPGRWEQVVVSVLLAITLILALWAAGSRPSLLRAAVVVGLLVVGASAIEPAGAAATRLANLLLVTLAPPAVVIGVVRALRAHNQVTVEAVFGVLCLYLLIGMAFAFAYGVIDRLAGDFFAQGRPGTVASCLYFSFTTLTTVGYGDLTAASNLGHTLAVTEALIGQIYLVTIVSVIVGNLGRLRRR